jgi:Fanconi anemia group M protein
MINMAIDSYIAVNVPLRDYQLAITKTALFTNTLVALPTGLGKTLTAAVVMYNYFRW